MLDIKGLAGGDVYHFDEIDSTNLFLMKGGSELPHGTIVIADVQKAGRGRLDRGWLSPKGGLWFSIILKGDFVQRNPHIILPVVGVTTAQTIRELLGLEAGIKWPNDVLIADKKVCGILAEMSSERESTFVVVGVGLNVNNDLEGLDGGIRERSTTLKDELSKDVDLRSILRHWVPTLERNLELAARDPGEVLELYRGVSFTLGKNVSVKTMKGELTGFATDIDPEGALLLKLENGDIERVLTGDVQT